MKEISRDFRESMAMLHREVQMLKRENAAIRKELEELKTVANSANDAAVKQRKQATTNAILQGDERRLQNLSDTSTDIAEQELLKMFAPQNQEVMSIPRINEELVSNMIAEYRQNSQGPVVQIEVTSEPSRRDIGQAIYNKMANDQYKANKARQMKEMFEAKAAQALAARQREANGMNLARRSDRWIGPMDNQDF